MRCTLVRVRFAPSPTGYIHIGNARTALFNYLFARSKGGEFILRIEDTDAARSRREYEEALSEDLRWLGIHWNEGPDMGGPYGPYRQSERTQIYNDYLTKLIKAGHAYYCYCTEAELVAMREDAMRRKAPPRYDNRCRTLTRDQIVRKEAEGVRPVVRFKIQDPELVVMDLIRGKVEFNLDDMVGDFVILKQDGMPTFHLAVCVDDALMKITHVIRGEDHLSNTPRHVLLFRALGFTPPEFAHMSLTASPSGGLLSKREGAVSIREYRLEGYPASGVVNYISLLGWSGGGTEEIFTPGELVQRFDLHRMKKSSAIFDRAKLEWVCGMHLRKLGDDEFVEHAFSFIRENKLLPPDALEKNLAWYREALLLFKDNIHNFAVLKDRLTLFQDPLEIEDRDILGKADTQTVLTAAAESLERIGEDNGNFWAAWINDLKTKIRFKGKELFIPLRVAITGKTEGPELKRVVELLGRKRVLERIQKARTAAAGT